MKLSKKLQQGYTLIELMIVAAVIGILSAIAIPSYQSYIQTSCLSTADMNLTTLRAYLENYALEYNEYREGDSSQADFTKALKWTPDDKGEFTYVVKAGTKGINTTYKITVTGQGACAGTTRTGGNE